MQTKWPSISIALLRACFSRSSAIFVAFTTIAPIALHTTLGTACNLASALSSALSHRFCSLLRLKNPAVRLCPEAHDLEYAFVSASTYDWRVVHFVASQCSQAGKYAWVETWSEEHNRPFYYDQAKHISTWDKPADLAWRRVYILLEAEAGVGAASMS